MIQDCIKNKFNCKKTFDSQLAESKVQFATMLANELAKQKAQYEAKLVDYKNWYEFIINRNTPYTIDWLGNNLTTDRLKKEGKPISDAQLQAIWKQTFNQELYGELYGQKRVNWACASHAMPMQMVKDFLKATQVDKLPYFWPTEKGQPEFVCRDFGMALFGALQFSPIWFGLLGLNGADKLFKDGHRESGHQINWFVNADDFKFYFIEPQNDSIWQPDYVNKEWEWFPGSSIW